MIDPTLFALRHAERPGCHFVGFRMVALPVFFMNLRAMVVRQRVLPTADEFILRSAHAGFSSIRECASLLGLSEALIEQRTIEMRVKGLVEVEADSDNTHIRMTDAGLLTARTLSVRDLSEVTLPHVAIHGWTRQPVAVMDAQAYSGKEVDQNGWLKMRPVPSRAPDHNEIDVRSLGKVLSSLKSNMTDQVAEVIGVRAVLRGVSTRYIPALMLEWQTFTHGNRQVGFVVDGKLDHVLERTFGEIKGMEVFSDYFDETPQSTDRIIDEAVPEEIRDRVRRTIVSTSEAILISKAGLELATEKENSRVEVIDPDRPDTRKAQADRIRDLENQVSELDNLHGSRPRLIWTADIRDLFHKALEIARERLVIMSAFVSDQVVDAKFENKLELCIQRGTKVYIVVGEMVDKNNAFRQAARARGLIRLDRLAKKYPSQFLLTFQEHHAKILVCDSEYAITGSFNFLSFSGNHKIVRDEGSILLKNPDIEPIFTELMLKYFQ